MELSRRNLFQRAAVIHSDGTTNLDWRKTVR
jgi:hypothetical protein